MRPSVVEQIQDICNSRSVCFSSCGNREDALTYMYVVCKDHVDVAIDKFIEEFEEAPDVVDLEHTKFIDWEPPVKCEECQHEARFLVV